MSQSTGWQNTPAHTHRQPHQPAEPEKSPTRHHGRWIKVEKAYNKNSAGTPVASAYRSPVRAAFTRVKVFVALYGALSVLVLLTLAVIAKTGHINEVSTFMWVRSSIIIASAALIYWLAGRASRGRRWAYGRVRLLTIILPVAIVAVDLIPGACPPWFALAQAFCALALVPTAFILNTRHVRAMFARS